ncbi:hypothetical protein DPMN_133364 [Dreissena polymorpha]|uniref:Uncharacterized protein n=1 Tax=Dreissena polymorpha TaxID=45954 RepID=A0A9D4G003_DREPO|nr:hypothetical protein DPMN_133364 [Dreissena polymorpha]
MRPARHDNLSPATRKGKGRDGGLRNTWRRDLDADAKKMDKTVLGEQPQYID